MLCPPSLCGSTDACMQSNSCSQVCMFMMHSHGWHISH